VIRFASAFVTVFVGWVAGGLLATGGLTILAMLGRTYDNAGQLWIQNGGALVGAGVAWLRWRNQEQAPTPDYHGSAVFGGERAASRALGNADGLIVARAREGWLMRYGGPAHLLTLAPTRSGKGVGAVIPNLLTAGRSILCIDPKGENARITARARASFGPVHVLDPFGVSGQPSSGFNPLAALDSDALDVSEDAAMIAEALVYDPPHQVGEAHWNEEAKALIAGFILHVAATEPPATRTLAKVRDLLTRAPQSLHAELLAMQKSPAANGLVARAANRHLGKSDREATGVLSAAQRHTHFLDSPRMAAVLGRSDFTFADLKTGLATVFLVLPPERLATHARWLRLLVVQALSELARQPRSGDTSVLFLFDEFAALGHLEPVERAFGLMAGYGVQLWAILQDLHQLKSLYGERAGTFLSNAGVIQVFNVADIDTSTWVSRTLGVMTESYETTSTSETQAPNSFFATHGVSTQPHYSPRALMTPDEVLRMSADRLLLLRPGQAPLAPRKVRYYADPEFRGLYDA
jgi:type IV secretion system protein VirD4